MAIKEIKRFNNGLNKFLSKFICDSVLDLANMPTSENGVVIGSTVLCLENKTEYMLSNSDRWLEIRDAYATVTYVDGKISGVFRLSGNWNANTNTPTLANNEPTNVGKVYYVTNAGTQFGLTFAIGDKLAFIEGGIATKWDNIDDVTTVNGKIGTVVIDADDIPFDGSGTNYLADKTVVESAIKELDTRVKTNADRIDGKQDKLVAGENISIDPITNVISASGGSGGIEDAPSDSKLYGRKDEAWEEIPEVPPMHKAIYQANAGWINESGTSYLFDGINGIVNPNGEFEFHHENTTYRRVKEVTFILMEQEHIDWENPPTPLFSEFKRVQSITIPLLINRYPGEPEDSVPFWEYPDTLLFYPIIFKKLDGTDVTIKVRTYSGQELYSIDDANFTNLQVDVTGLDSSEVEDLPIGSPTQNIQVVIKYESTY